MPSEYSRHRLDCYLQVKFSYIEIGENLKKDYFKVNSFKIIDFDLKQKRKNRVEMNPLDFFA